MPIKIVQNNERVAEVQFFCDCCGKLARTSLIPRQEAEAQKDKEIICWQCKQAKPSKK